MVRIELCSMRTMGRSACSGIVDVVRVVLRVGSVMMCGGEGEVAIASVGNRQQQEPARSGRQD